MIVICLGLALAFLAGFLTATLLYNIQRDRRQKQREQRRKAVQENRRMQSTSLPEYEVADVPAMPIRILPETEKKAEDTPPKEKIVEKAPESKPVRSPQPAQKPETPQERMERLYKSFRGAESLELQFQYAFPDTVLFQPGEGYLRNDKNEVIPVQKVFSSANSTMGYAMEGLFRVYDVVYRGKTFTFQQIMDGEIGNVYVQVRDISAPAVVAATGHYGSYTLKRKGLLKIADLQ